MRFSEIISEGPAQAVGQAVGKTAYNVGSAAGKGVAMLNKATAPDPQAAADSAAIKKGISSGLTKWATGKSELSSGSDGSDGRSSSAVSNTTTDALLTGLIDGDTTVSKPAISNLKTKLPTMRLPWTMDINTLNAALDQALADKPLDQTQINSLKTLQQHLKKV